MGPRVDFSVLLFLSGALLLGAIALGNRMGNHVLVQVSERTEVAPTPLLTPVPGAKDRQVSLGWKKTQLVSVATDPAFPDPRVTPVAPAPLPPSARRGRKHGRHAAPEPTFTLAPLPPLPPLDKRDEPASSQEAGTPIPYETPQQ
jgi:hypothetical protein